MTHNVVGPSSGPAARKRSGGSASPPSPGNAPVVDRPARDGTREAPRPSRPAPAAGHPTTLWDRLRTGLGMSPRVQQVAPDLPTWNPVWSEALAARVTEHRVPATTTVLPGEGLSQVAARVLGNAGRWRELYDLNRDVIGPDPNKVYPGQVLRLPSGTAVVGRPVPYINQFYPAGAGNGYYNGPANCGPTSMAMVARSFGYGGGMSDAKLINHLGRLGGTTENGTGVEGIGRIARAIGLTCETRGPGAQVAWMVQQLEAGKVVIANGDYHEMPPHQNPNRTSGHYVTVVGLMGNDFIVNDPADPNVRRVSREDMARFIRSNPNGGYQFAIGT